VRAATDVADDALAAVHGLERLDELAGPEGLREVPVHALREGRLHQLGVEVPGVDDDAARGRVRDEGRELVVVGLGLGERVVEHDVDAVGERRGGVDLGDGDAVAVLVEHVGEAREHDVVVVDEGDGDVAGRDGELRGGHGITIPPRGVCRHTSRGGLL
jgi:hypothetical protein